MATNTKNGITVEVDAAGLVTVHVKRDGITRVMFVEESLDDVSAVVDLVTQALAPHRTELETGEVCCPLHEHHVTQTRDGFARECSACVEDEQYSQDVAAEEREDDGGYDGGEP